VFDADCRHDYLCGGLLPGRFKPDRSLPSEWWDTYVFRAPTLAELARKIEVSPETLAASVARSNKFAKTGKDLDFGRGDHAYGRIMGGGDPKIRPNPCLAPIARAPFYAMRVFLGDLGTRGGLKTNPNAQVLTPEGAPIPGLYAAGNTATSVFRNCYPGPGATLGPAMSFAYIAAKHIAATARKISEAAQ
jgi:3-oxosteroid 1-dehydrogenase